MIRVYTKEILEIVHVIVLNNQEYTQLQDLLKRDTSAAPFVANLLAKIHAADRGIEDDAV